MGGGWCPWLSLGVVTARVGAARGGVWVLVSMAVPWCGDSPCWSSKGWGVGAGVHGCPLVW